MTFTIHKVVQPLPPPSLRTFPSPQKDPSHASAVTPYSCALQAATKQCSVSMIYLGTSYKWIHRICGFLHLASSI